ncbi:hypothetical protein J4220_00425 [Candidatus Micrarchaeota archaeon]|nr:hypothetical protein [Candidatus Micrarchaeota archaeon]HIH20299.1 hypothetical protein [Candidatus Micrarchaeota archaeon]
MQVKTSLQGLKGYSGKSESSEREWTYSPVWLPVQTEGRGVMKVSTRQEFMNMELGNWRLIQVSRVAAIVLGVGALYALTWSILVSAALALLAGWSWGVYARKAFFFERVNRNREILEGT